MKRFLLSLVVLCFITFNVKAQDGYIQQGEFGFSVGGAHYFGDLNTRAGLNRPKPALGLFFRKQFGNYVGLRVAGRFAQMGYDDLLSKNDYQHTRGLEFNTNIFEFGVQGDFNFFKYIPNDVNYGFTPYITLGLGVFSYNPYATYDGEKYYLLSLATPIEKNMDISTMGICIPLGVGLKYSINKKVNLSFEISNRFTTKDNIDAVSTQYSDFWDPSTINSNNPMYKSQYYDPSGQPMIEAILQDRSMERGGALKPLGIEGRQRGWSKQKDQYVIAEIGISFNIGSYRCPTAN